jgi:hypothetical protein
MRDRQEESGEDRSGASPLPESEASFPTEAIVGVIEEPREVLSAVKDLRSAGYEPEVLCGDRGVERIENAGGSARDVRLIRVVQGLFGYEAEHTARHTKELEKGNFLVLVKNEDGSTDKVRDVFADHDGRFVNYYSRWTSRVLIP